MNDPSPEPRPDLTPLTSSDAKVRRTGRMRCNMLTCEYGQVVDLSAAGMRIRRRGSSGLHEGDRVEVTLGLMSKAVTVSAEVVWTRKTGFRRREIGLEFRDLSDQIKDALTEIARCASKLEQFRPENAA